MSQKRIVSNADIFNFEISDEDMKELDGLDEYHVSFRKKRGLTTDH